MFDDMWMHLVRPYIALLVGSKSLVASYRKHYVGI